MCRSHIGPLTPQEDTASQRGREGLAWEMQERKREGGQTQESQHPAPTQTGPRISDNQASSSTKTLQGKRPCPGQTTATEASTRVQGALEASSPAERSGIFRKRPTFNRAR